MIKVLVFPCGSEIGLEVHKALQYDKHIELFGLSSVSSHGSMVYKNYIEGIPMINEKGFIDELNKIIAKNDIDVLVPAYDDVILFLSENRDKVKCKIVTSDREVCNIARSKKKTYSLLKERPYIPLVYSIDSITESDLPLFAKPDIGQGSGGIVKINTLEDLELIRSKADEYVICEYLPGKEYTIDAFTDEKGNILALSMRERTRIKMGISVHSETMDLPAEVREIALDLNDQFRFNGVWFFQVKLDHRGRYKLLEFAPRVAGTMSISRVRGFNFILNSVYQTMGYKVKAIPHLIDNVSVDRALSNAYSLNLDYERVYLDFDDTVYLGEDVNIILMAFLYQCRNKGIKVTLLSRHIGDLQKDLSTLSISSSLFDETIVLDENQAKSDYIKEEKAIFIDDSFRERYDVSENKNIPVFDLDSIEALIDWRI